MLDLARLDGPYTGGEDDEKDRSRAKKGTTESYAQERLTRGTVTSTMRRAAQYSGYARCGAGVVRQ